MFKSYGEIDNISETLRPIFIDLRVRKKCNPCFSHRYYVPNVNKQKKMLSECWVSVIDNGPTSKIHSLSQILSTLNYLPRSRHITIYIVQQLWTEPGILPPASPPPSVDVLSKNVLSMMPCVILILARCPSF